MESRHNSCQILQGQSHKIGGLGNSRHNSCQILQGQSHKIGGVANSRNNSCQILQGQSHKIGGVGNSRHSSCQILQGQSHKIGGLEIDAITVAKYYRDSLTRLGGWKQPPQQLPNIIGTVSRDWGVGNSRTGHRRLVLRQRVNYVLGEN